MQNKLYPSLLVLGSLCLAAWTAHAQLQRSSAGKQGWEYRSIIIVREARSNAPFSDWAEVSAEGAKQLSGPVSVPVKAKELGSQGWELVSVTPISNNSCGQDCAGFTSQILYWFKRPK